MTFKRILALALSTLLLLGTLTAMGETAPAPEAVEPAPVEETVPAEEAAPADETAPAEEEAAPAEEEAAPAEHFFAAMNLTYLDGTPFDTSVFEGTPIFLNIWATWCSPCLMEMPHLNELAEEYADKINIVGVHAEALTVTEAGELATDEEKTATALELKEEMNLTYPLLNPDITLFILMNDPQYGLQVSALPTTWFIDGDGYIRNVVPGYKDKDGWKNAIDEFLIFLEAEPVEADEQNEG